MKNVIYEYANVKPPNLSDYIIATPSLHQYFKLHWKELKSRQYCGILNYDAKDYYLLPKISNDKETNLNIFVYMIRYAYDIKLNNEDLASSKNEKHHNFLEVFIQLFAKRLFKELQAGIYKEYITEQDNLTTLRGKYLISENLKYNFTNAKIYCEYDEFSMDNTLNQFFLYAIKTLLPFAKNKKLLKLCELALDEVEYKKFDINSLKVHFHRLNNRFKGSFEFAILLLSKSIPLFEKDKKSFAFLFDMNVLFEKFIGKIYEDIDSTTELQTQKDFGNLRLKPDIIVKSKNLIIDCKYKIIEDDKISSREDRYQMYVYANNFENENKYKTMLLYPKHFNQDEDLKRDLTLGENDKKVELLMRSIDLDFNGGYEEFLEEIKKRLGKFK